MKRIEFLEKLQKSEPGKKYLQLVQQQSKELLGETISEKHHIFPKSLGGANNPGNMVELSCYDHVLAHYYLALALPEESKMLYAFACIAAMQFKKLSDLEQVKVEHLEYWGRLRELATKLKSGRIKVHKGTDNKFVTPGELNVYVENGWERGVSDDVKERQSRSQTGNINARGHKMSEEARKRSSESHKRLPARSEEYRKKVGDTFRKKVWIHRGVEEMRIELDQLAEKEKEGWSRGQSKQHRKAYVRKNTRRWMTNGIDSKYVSVDEVELWESRGYRIGRVLLTQ